MEIREGTRLGIYEIVGELGAGGMGRVYRARDTRLGREVALKIVHPHLGRDPEYARRFRREAEIVASLTHPHIAAVHQLEESDSFWFLVMELVGGETLGERLDGGQLSISETLRVASQIALALEAAHEKGIIHRDLKPNNIKITSDGVVKVLDFGLAKTLPAESSSAGPSKTATDTHTGVIVGTAAYMSPEQARGRPIDKRTDVWAFGCVVFEMLTNRRAFGGESAADTITSILEREPNWDLLPKTTPSNLRRLLKRCLEKDLPRRLRDLGDARLDIEDTLAAPVGTATDSAQSFQRRISARAITIFGVGIAVGALVAAATMPGRTPDAPSPVVQFAVPLPPNTQLTNLDFPAAAISPDGTHVVFVARGGGRPQLFIKAMHSLDVTPLAQTEDAISPFFSPDSHWIGFFSGGKLKKVPVGGGIPVTVCDAPIGFGATWGPRDLIVFAATSGSGLSQVSAAGGTPTRVTTLDAAAGEFSHRWPQLLPDGDTVLFTVGKLGSWDDAQIVAQSLSSRTRRVLVEGGTSPRYVNSGHLVYARNGDLLAVPFDPATLGVTGRPQPILDGVIQSFDGAAQVSISGSGHILYIAGSVRDAERQVVAVDRSGAVIPLAAPVRPYVGPRMSPDGRQLLVTIGGPSESLWLYNLAQGLFTQVAFEGNNSFPVWAPGGQHLVFSSNRTGPLNMFRAELGSASPPERLAPSELAQVPGSWSPDAGTLAFVERHPTTGRDIWMLPMMGVRKPQPFVASMFDETTPRFSPDGRLVAYVSNESGQNEVYVRSYSGPVRFQKVSTTGGAEPIWASSGRELFFRIGDQVMGASVDPATARVGTPNVIFRGDFAMGSLDSPNYDVMPDGQRFVMVSETQRTAPRELHVVLNWVGSVAAAMNRTGNARP
jgi:eukaryotic-like serine/threonine-protein kinase